MKRLDGKVAFITGAARGQGRSHALRFAEEGAHIVAIDICEQIDSVRYPLATAEDLEETRRLVAETGQGVIAMKADVRDSAQLKAAVDAGLAEFGHIDVLAANAGITGMGGPVHELSDEEWDDILAVDLTGVFRTVRAVLPSMIAAQRGGSIIITSSIAGLLGFGWCAPYSAAKHGLVGLMRALVNEVSDHSIRVNTVHPSSVNTPMIMNDLVIGEIDPENQSVDTMCQVLEREHTLPVPWLESEDISSALVWLASDESRYVTGLTMALDAGKTTKSR